MTDWVTPGYMRLLAESLASGAWLSARPELNSILIFAPHSFLNLYIIFTLSHIIIIIIIITDCIFVIRFFPSG